MRRIAYGLFTLFIVIAQLGVSQQAHALRQITDVSLTEVEAMDNGVCIARSNKWIGVGCAGFRMSFQCNSASDKTSAYRMFDIAQMAIALNRTVLLQIDDVNKIDGYCVVKTIRIGPI